MWAAYRVKVEGLKTRTAPGLGAATIAVWRYGEQALLDTAHPVVADGYIWLRHALGWSAVRALHGTWVGLAPLPVEAPPDPQPQPEPQPPAETGPPAVAEPLFTDEQLAAIQAIVAAAVDEALQPYRRHAATMADAWGSLCGYLPEETAQAEGIPPSAT